MYISKKDNKNKFLSCYCYSAAAVVVVWEK